jgi:gamma-tubulin complex component 5
MASSTTMNAWMEELVLSLLPPSTPQTLVRKYKESFIRQVKNHNCGRTNQFDVIERLNGLEEKLQVLNLDDVAEELYSRRMRLNITEDRWLPDVLDLLLHLCVDPIRNSRVGNLERIQPKPKTPPPLRWADIEANDPIDRGDDIWNIPEYSDLSSDEDEALVSSTTTSPVSEKRQVPITKATSRIFEEVGIAEETSASSNLTSSQFWNKSGFSITTTEQQSIREILMMLNGFPTSMFNSYGNELKPDPRYRLLNVEVETSSRFLTQAAELGSKMRSVMGWLEKPQSESVMQLIQSRVRDILLEFHRFITQLQMDVSNEDYSTGVITLLELLHRINGAIAPLKSVAGLLPQLPNNEPVIALNTLYRYLDLAYSCCDQPALDTILPVFSSAFEMYAAPVDGWIQTGTVDANAHSFFISKVDASKSPATLWHDWFSLVPDKDRSIPSFLENYGQRIFIAGKTAALLQYLDPSGKQSARIELGLAQAAEDASKMIKNLPIPFAATFEMTIDSQLSSILSASTIALRRLLEEHCGLSRLLDAFQYIYLGKNGAMLDNFEAKMFDQIDRCVEIWNDRFLVADTLAETFVDVRCIDSELINVQSTYTSSRSMESRRRSVKILSALTVSYDLSWPISNLILPETVISYQRIALILSQIRRAKVVLERRAYFCVQNIPLTGEPAVQNMARALCFTLSVFVNIVYDHFTTCTISPMTNTMRGRLEGSVDEMISIHNEYIRYLELACLCGKRIKPLRDSLLILLDLCIRFTDIVSSPLTAANRSSTDFEASSFISARSQRRRRRNAEPEISSSSDEEEEDGIGEGYSTFILDEDTSVKEEITKIKQAFTKHVTFLMAGLRGVARSSGEIGDLLELLADSLEGVFPQKRIRVY